jgi:hypothetical protein
MFKRNPNAKKWRRPNSVEDVVSPRKIARAVAKYNLAKQGNLHRAIKSNHFSNNWRKYAVSKNV